MPNRVPWRRSPSSGGNTTITVTGGDTITLVGVSLVTESDGVQQHQQRHALLRIAENSAKRSWRHVTADSTKIRSHNNAWQALKARPPRSAQRAVIF